MLAKQFGSSPSAFEEAVENDFDFSQLPDFGETLRQNIHQWFAQEENRILWEELQEMVTIQTVTTETHSMEDNPFVGCTMVVTGKVEPYTRSGINAKIESFGYHGRRITNFEMEGSALAGLAALMGHRAATICTIIAQRIAQNVDTDYKPFVRKMISTALDKLAVLK